VTSVMAWEKISETTHDELGDSGYPSESHVECNDVNASGDGRGQRSGSDGADVLWKIECCGK
jgi:hypothetical protein